MIQKWLKEIEAKAKAAEAAGEVFGACLLPDPNGGADMCVQLDKDTCTQIGGTYQGGPC